MDAGRVSPGGAQRAEAFSNPLNLDEFQPARIGYGKEINIDPTSSATALAIRNSQIAGHLERAFGRRQILRQIVAAGTVADPGIGTGGAGRPRCGVQRVAAPF